MLNFEVDEEEEGLDEEVLEVDGEVLEVDGEAEADGEGLILEAEMLFSKPEFSRGLGLGIGLPGE